MAEFIQVIKQAKRICNIYGTDEVQCKGCPLNRHNGCRIFYNCFDCDDTYLIKIEKHVMDWAKENPETVYPSWKEWHRNMFPNSDISILPCWFMPSNPAMCNTLENCERCRSQPIPAEIAKKLGINPIKGYSVFPPRGTKGEDA